LKRLGNLRVLRISLPDLTHTGVATIRGFSNLKFLALTLREPTDAGLENLHKLINLSRLRLLTLRSIDSRLAGLKALSAVRNLVVPRGEITDAEVDELQQALPATKVFPLWFWLT
jgi:hypothetical protein